MEMQNEKVLEALMQQEKKDTKPRIIKEYRTVKEQYPWNVLVFPSVFPIIGFCVLAKSLADFAAQNKFGGYSFLIIALIFFGMGIMFLYPTNSEFGFCKQLREEIKKAQNKGAIYKGEIKGYTFNVRKVIPTETVLNVYTRQEYRKQGYAKQLMNVLLEDAKANALSVIELKATEDGYHLYKTVGFEDVVSKYYNMRFTFI